MDKFILSVVLLLAASASVKSQYNTCTKNLQFCVSDYECCTNYCEYALGEEGDGYGLCTEWPFPNCGRDGDDCLYNTDCCHGFCAHEQNNYASFNYCTSIPYTNPISYAPLPAPSGSTPVPVAEGPIDIQYSPPSPHAPEISPSFGIAPGPLADSEVPTISPSSDIAPVPSTTTTPPTPPPCDHGKVKKHRSRKWKHPKAPKAPPPGTEF